MQASRSSVPYPAFGELFARLRVSAGFSKQQEMATALGVTQQTVSRWEKGLGRPRARDIPQMEKVLRAKDEELLVAAGYPATSAHIRSYSATSHDRPLPLSALPPDTFESFCTSLLDRMYQPNGGTVQRYGRTGHKQHGIDIFAAGSFGTHSFQCKRVNEFGAQKVHTAVAEQTFPADLKVLLLSSVASPSSRDAIAAHAAWELWDQEDITRRLHNLPLVDRVDLVDRFFSGQRFDLLGIEEPGPIQSPDEFFKPLLVSGRYFNHAWALVGREEEVSQVVEGARDNSVTLTCLLGAPGAGKSRVLREVTQRLAQSARLHVRFVSPTEEVRAHHLDGLRDSRGNMTLLVVDDAHEREDLGILLRYAAAPENLTRLLLSLRPYGKESLRLQAADVSLTGPTVKFVEMRPQSMAQACALAESVLAESCPVDHKSPSEAATEIARATYTTPLVTVLAAQLVARDGVSLAVLGNTEEFRTHVLRSLQDVITASLVTGQDVVRLRAVLRIVALLQPIIPDDPGLFNILLNTEGVEQADASRLMRLLGDAGVLFNRGLRSRLAPDLLADEVIASNYLNADGSANERVTQVFEQAGTEHLKNLFVNLGRLDWRRREGNTYDSALLNSLSPKLSWGEKYSNPHVEAVEAVAYYQPRFALDFARRLITDGHGHSSSVCNMVRNAAYTYDHLQEACHLLWSAGRSDDRALHQQPSHGIRILKELAEFQVNKPIEYVREVIHYALGLLERPTSLRFTYTPFSILEGALCTEMESTSFSRSTMTITRYELPLDKAQSVRNEITNALLKYLREGPPRRAFLAAETMAKALQGPTHGNTSNDGWRLEHVRLLRELKIVLSDVHVSPVVLVRIAKSVSWHAFYGLQDTSLEARAILEYLKRDLRTRLTRALIDGWGTETWEISKAPELEEHVMNRQLLTTDLVTAFPEPNHLFSELHACLEEISSVAHSGYGSSYILVNHLMCSVPGLATELLLRDNSGRVGCLEQYVGVALSAAFEAGDSSLVDDYVRRSEVTSKALAQLAEAYTRFGPSRPYTPEEVKLFRRIFESRDPTVLLAAARMTRQVAIRSPALAVELICLADFQTSSNAAHDMFMWLSGNQAIPEIEVAGKRDELLAKLVALKELNDYWVKEFLVQSTRRNPASVVTLVKARLLEAKRRHDLSYNPLDKEHRGNGLGLMDVEAGPRLLRDLLNWALEHSNDISSARYVGEAVSGLCGNYCQAALDALLDWMSSGTQAHAVLVARVLQESQSSLIFEHAKFIRDILDEAEIIGGDALDEIRSALAISVHSGGRCGVPGEPFPEDLRMEQHCKQMLATLSRAEPAFDLYDRLLKDARYSISRQRKSKEAMEEDDDQS